MVLKEENVFTVELVHHLGMLAKNWSLMQWIGLYECALMPVFSHRKLTYIKPMVYEIKSHALYCMIPI